MSNQTENAPIRRLLCACCGAVTRGRQWHNQDTGYGLCVACVGWLAGRDVSAEELRRCYGDRGVNFDLSCGE